MKQELRSSKTSVNSKSAHFAKVKQNQQNVRGTIPETSAEAQTNQKAQVPTAKNWKCSSTNYKRNTTVVEVSNSLKN